MYHASDGFFPAPTAVLRSADALTKYVYRYQRYTTVKTPALFANLYAPLTRRRRGGLAPHFRYTFGLSIWKMSPGHLTVARAGMRRTHTLCRIRRRAPSDHLVLQGTVALPSTVG